MPEFNNVALLAGDAVLYFAALAALLRARSRIGLGAFFCALGVMHFLETYLASIFYVSLPLGIVTSPGSTVLFTGKLMLLLLLYIREDAKVVRQPIYGLLFGNVLLFALAFVMRHHTLVPLAPGRAADFAFLNEMGALMVWGTAILFFDCIIIILLYERSRAWLGDRVFARLVLCGALVLSFDQVAFFAGLRMLTGAGVAPCQCFSPGGIQTVSPARTCRIGPPQVCTWPMPDVMCKVCPSGWVCQAVRAPGSKRTQADRRIAGSGA